MDAVSATARLLGDPPAGQRGSDSVTKREAIVMVTATATMYFFWPERLWIFKTMFNIALVGWITALAFDAREAGIEAWDGIPAWLKNYLGGGGVAGGNVHVQRSRVPNGKSSGNPAVKQLQQVMKQIRSARLTQDVWGVIRPIIIHCLRTALHYLEPPEGGFVFPPFLIRTLILGRAIPSTRPIKVGEFIDHPANTTQNTLESVVRHHCQNTTCSRLWFVGTQDAALG